MGSTGRPKWLTCPLQSDWLTGMRGGTRGKTVRWGGRALLAVGALLTLGAAGLNAPLTLPVDPFLRMRGFCFEGPPRRPEHDPMAEMAALGANWVSLSPFAWMRGPDDPALRFDPARGWWGERDEGLAECAARAHAAGLRVMLKPHIWLRGGAWSGEVAMRSDADWAAWFLAYKRWMLHCARLAERERMDALVVGAELAAASLEPANEPEWRRLIAAVRQRYGGPLLWSANWHEEFERLPFWDALDWIGVAVYFPVSEHPDPSDEEIRAVWRSAAVRIGETARRLGKPVIFTEAGYRSDSEAAREPWRWDSDAPANPGLQARLFEALFQACWEEPWFGGVFVWKWHAEPGGRRDVSRDFTPQGKPALEVIRHWFRRGGIAGPGS